MSEQRLIDMQASLSRIEVKLDASTAWQTQHAAEDAIVAADVRMLARRQRGFLTVLGGAVTAVGAAVAWAIERFIRQH